MVLACEFKVWGDVVECRRELANTDLKVRLYSIVAEDDDDREPTYYVDYVSDDDSLPDLVYTVRKHRGKCSIDLTLVEGDS